MTNDIVSKLNDREIICICEGASESYIVNLLLKEDKLIFSDKDLIGFEPFVGSYYRKGANFNKIRENHMGMYGIDKVVILLFQDGEEIYKVNNKEKKYIEDIFYTVTSPELEMLHVFSLDLYDEYQRYCKNHNDNKPSKFLQEYFKKRESEIKSKPYIESLYEERSLEEAIKKHYFKTRKRKKSIHLYDLLKDKI